MHVKSSAKRVASLLAIVLAASMPVATHASATCADSAGGGEWPWDGSDLYGTRSQPLEDAIGPGNAGSLAPAWAFSLRDQGASGRLTTMPIVAEGCVYLQASAAGGSNPNRIFAINAETGEYVWDRALLASGGISSPHVENGVIYIYEPSNAETHGVGPHVLALNSQTGDEIYAGEGVCAEPGCANNSGGVSPIVTFDDMVWFGITNHETNGSRVGGFAITDASNGKLLKRTFTIPDDQAAVGYGGCAIWAAPAIDPDTKYGFVGTAQPSNWTGKESERCNAIIKFDLARARDRAGNPVDAPICGGAHYAECPNPNFGEIVGALKGTADDPPYTDIDFGGSGATILDDADGNQIVTQMQKSGWLHAAYTRHMTRAWSTPNPGYGYIFGAYTKTATDGENVFTVGNFGGPLSSVNGTNGNYNWVHPVVAPLTQGSVAYANGVVYYVDEIGVLTGADAETGLPVLKRALPLDHANCRGENVSPGVSVARNTVWAICGPVVFAMRLPASA